MAVTIANLAVKVAADTGQAQSGILGLATMLGPGGAFVAAGLAAAAVIVGIGAVTVKMAGDFQAGMTSLVTGAGESQKNIGMVSQAVLQMAVDTGTSTSQLTSGLYMIESAGYHGAAGLSILQAAAEGAKVGNADLGTVADATTTLMTDFGTQTGGATGAVNALIATVSAGKTHLSDLATSLAQVAPTAAAAHVKLTDMMGALATMTGEGVPAAQAATYLRQTIIGLDAPSSAAAKAMASVGLSSTAVATEMQQSLPGALKMITDAVGKQFPVGSAAYVEALKNISGGSKTMQGMLDLTGNHLATFQGNVANITGAMQKGGTSINGWSLVQGDFNQKMDVAKEVVETTGIKIGTGLLPVVGRLVDAFSTGLPVAITDVTNGFNTVVSVGQGVISFFNSGSIASDGVKVALVVLGGAMLGFAASAIPAAITGLVTSIVAFYAQAAAATAAAIATLAAAAPFILIGAAIALVAVGIYELVTHWAQVSAFFTNLGAVVMGFLTGVWNRITSTVASWGNAFKSGLDAIGNFIQAAFNGYVAMVELPFTLIGDLFVWLYNHNTYIHDLVTSIQNDFTAVKTFITDVWNGIKTFLGDAFAFVMNVAQTDWLAVQTYIITPIRNVIAQVEERIDYAKALLDAAWVYISAQASAAWNRFTGVISSAVGLVGTYVHNIISAITTPVTNLGQTLFNAGKNLIQMLINGITSMAGAVGNAASGIAKNITSFLGFHSPTEQGPGATADQWMPALGAMLTTGLAAQAAPAGAAANKIAAAISTGIKSATTAPALGVSSGGNAAAISGLPSGMTQMPNMATATANGQPIQVNIYMDGKKVAQAVIPQMPAVLRSTTGNRNM